MKRLLLLLLFLPLVLNAQQDNNQLSIGLKETTWDNFTYDMENVFGGVFHSYSRPFHWQKKQWSNFAYVAAGTATLYHLDDEFDDWANGWRGDVPQGIVDYGNNIGSPNNNFMVTGAVYLTGLFTKNEKLRRTGVLLISSAAASGLLQQVSKRIIGRARPKSGRNSNVFDPLHLDRIYNYDSFPSGHAMLGFTNAYAIAKQFDNPWVKVGLYTVGSLPGLARIVDRFHWITDVAFSTAISIFIVEAIDKYLDKKYDKKYNDKRLKEESSFDWDLMMGPGQVGVVLTF